MSGKRFVVEGDGVIYATHFSDEKIRDLIRFGTVVSVFRQTVAGIQYADVDQITHEIDWTAVKVQEE